MVAPGMIARRWLTASLGLVLAAGIAPRPAAAVGPFETAGFARANGVYDFRDGSQGGLTESNGIMVRWDLAKDTWVAISAFGGVPLK